MVLVAAGDDRRFPRLAIWTRRRWLAGMRKPQARRPSSLALRLRLSVAAFVTIAAGQAE
jgi:hypothetical protein